MTPREPNSTFVDQITKLLLIEICKSFKTKSQAKSPRMIGYCSPLVADHRSSANRTRIQISRKQRRFDYEIRRFEIRVQLPMPHVVVPPSSKLLFSRRLPTAPTHNSLSFCGQFCRRFFRQSYPCFFRQFTRFVRQFRPILARLTRVLTNQTRILTNLIPGQSSYFCLSHSEEF